MDRSLMGGYFFQRPALREVSVRLIHRLTGLILVLAHFKKETRYAQ
jgi:hypothetical protein